MAIPQQGGILYALVARGTDVLAEYIPQGLAGNFAQVTRVLLARIDPQQARASYILDGYQFHFIVVKQLTYLCMADEHFGSEIPFDFLEDVKMRFAAAHGPSSSTAIAYSFNSEFSSTLQSRMDYYNNASFNTWKLSVVQNELSQARSVMAENINRVLERGDRIELLVDKSDQLDASALQFKKRSTRLKRSLWWKNVKLLALVGVCVLAVLEEHTFRVHLARMALIHECLKMSKPSSSSIVNDQVSFAFDGTVSGGRQSFDRAPRSRNIDKQPLLDAKELEKSVTPVIVGPSSGPLNSSTRYGMWATNMTVACALGLVGSATVIFYWLYLDAVFMTSRDIILSIYGLIIGAAITVYEARWTRRSATNFPWRAVVYFFLAVPGLFSIITLVAAAHLIVSSGAHMISAAKSETFVQERKVRPEGNRTVISANQWWNTFKFSFQEPNIVGEVTALTVWIAVNFVLFFDVLFTWFSQIDAMPSNFSASQFVAWAKAWGAILDFNCGLILLPVCRTFIRYLYDYSTQSQTRSQRMLRRILAFVPLDKALEFHKVIAWLVLFAGVIHTIMHLVNYGLSPDYTWQFYGIWPWTTGVAIFICMMFMYGATPHNVKWSHFEIFWYCHHFFIGFFIFLIPHGRGGFNRNVWKSLIIVIPIYLLERLYRAISAYRTVALTSITNMENVVAVGFDRKSAFPSGYKEGQYLYLNVPSISKGEWHPFTISSAPQENDVTVHIRVLDADSGTSWTAKLADFCSLLMPPKTSFVSFTNTNNKSGTHGKILGPDGTKLFRIYGPHSAPTQHVSEYSIAMVIGAGIGVTPVSATMKSITHYRWKFSIGRSYPDHVYFYFVTSHKEINAFRWVVRMLKEADDEVHNLWAVNKAFVEQKTFQFHIFVTSVPENCKPFEPINIEDDVKFWGSKLHADENLILVNAEWTEMQLLNTLQCPSRSTDRLGNVYVHRGRPDWSEQFQHVADTHPANDIGVAYCGNPIIASDLKQQCVRWSNAVTKTYFRLHKENF